VKKAIGLALAVCGLAAGQQARHVVVFGVDGLSASAVTAERTPAMDGLMRRGMWTLRARAILPTVSAPNWSAMIMGAGPDITGVTSNEWRPGKFEIAPFCHDGAYHPPTVFGAIRKAKPEAVSALFTDWEGFVRLIEPAAASDIVHIKDDAPAIVDRAIEYVAARKPALTFIHVDHVDHAGHGKGWYTPAYFEAVAQADAMLKRVLEGIEKAGLGQATVVLVTSDHGGHDQRHGGMQQSDIEIPWIAAGPGIGKGVEIKGPVSTIQTAPSIAQWLGVAPDPCWVATPVRAGQ
jgi:predicted AlkP superfamily pyrophosphatase or phosphodiesterase